MKPFFIFFSLFTLLIACQEEVKKETKPTSKDPIENRIQAIQEELKKSPRNAALYIERAKLHEKREEMEDALTDYMMGIKLDSTKPAYYLAVTEFFIHTGNIEKAINASEIAANLDPKDPIYYINAGKCCLYLKEYQRGITFLNQALERDKFNPEAYLFKGIIYKESGTKDKAISNFITASEQDPTWDAPFHQLATLYAEDKNDLALKYFDNAYRANPKNLEAVYQKALFFKDNKRDAKAKEALRDVIAINPMMAKAIYAMGLIYYEEDSIQKALQNFELSTKVEQTYYKGYFMQGQCHEKLKNKAAARKAYESCLVFKDDFEEAKKAMKGL